MAEIYAGTLTTAYEPRFTKIVTDSNFLRLGIFGGEGISGFTYLRLLQQRSLMKRKLVIDPGTLGLIDESKIYYVEEMV